MPGFWKPSHMEITSCLWKTSPSSKLNAWKNSMVRNNVSYNLREVIKMRKSIKILLSLSIATVVLLPGSLIVNAKMKPLSNAKSFEEQKRAPFENDKFKKEKEIAKENRAPKGKTPEISPNEEIPKANDIEFGIIEDSESMDLSIISQNVWVGKVDDAVVRIYAGSEREDKNQGVVSVVSESPDHSVKIKKYIPSQKDGLLKVISEENDNLILESKNGKKYPFGKKSHELKEK